MSERPQRLLLFDLGRVVVEVTGERDIQQYLKAPLELGGRWPAMEVWDEFERGLLTPEQFSQRFVQQLSLTIGPERFLEEFAQWTRGLLPGAGETLAALRPRFRLAALSNSNEVHWRTLSGHGVQQQFERAFSSHELGLRKPAVEIYEHVLREMEVAAADVTFFDDQEPNVAAARKVGLQAHRVEGIDELRACLQELGYLD
jgi:glucose-1-phosphatase